MARNVVLYMLGMGLFVLTGCSTTGGYREFSEFTDQDKEIILSFYGQYAAPPTPGPEGLKAKPAQIKSQVSQRDVMTKKLARGAGYPLPRDLESQLSPLAPGLARAMVGWSVVIVDTETRKVVDRIHARGY